MKTRTNVIYSIIGFAILIIILLAGVYGITTIMQKQALNDSIFVPNGKTFCQYQDGNGLLAIQFYCRMNSTQAFCSNEGGTQLPTFLGGNYSYLNYQQCNKTQLVIVNSNKSTRVIDT